jgi:hypothetical protein
LNIVLAGASVTPQSHTIFTTGLFFALNALLLWTARRERNAAKRRNAQTATAQDDTSKF